MKFFSIQNWRAFHVTSVDKPWELVGQTQPPPPYGDKDAMREYNNSAATRHHYISACEGTTAEVRVSTTENPPYKLHGFIIDYDAIPAPEKIEKITTEPAAEFLPTWRVVTSSNKARLVWAFERPLMIVNGVQLKEFLRAAFRAMKFDKWLPGFDDTAYSNIGQYYELGREWIPVAPAAVIPSTFPEMWMVQASRDLKFDTQSKFEYSIPMVELAAEVRAQFPGRWAGNFDVGARGVRFWDPSADNPTGAIVRADGMQCFTGGQPFVSWRQIFGPGFVDKYEANYVAAATANTAYDGTMFWSLGPDGQWQEIGKQDFGQDLLVRGFKGVRKGGAASDIDIIENTIKRTKRVNRALPFLYFPSGIIAWEGQRYLNTSRIRCLQPAAPFTAGTPTFADGMKHFPFIYELVKTFFNGPEEKEDGQLDSLLAWMKYFYVNSLNFTPRPGHCIIIAGTVGKGKTLFSKRILGGLMGGANDASDFLVKGSEWTAQATESPIMCIDDQLAAADSTGLLRFSNRIKKLVANAEMQYNQKYQKTGTVPWFGRTVITCNTDSESMKILPNMDISTQDKVNLYRTSDSKVKFPDWDTVDAKLRRELPNFARFLLDCQYPAGTLAEEKRFGIRAYHHPEMFEEARQQGVGVLLELLTGFMDQWLAARPEGHPRHWEGMSTQLHNDLAVYSPGIMRDMSPRALSTQLGILAKNKYGIMRIINRESGLASWRISPEPAKVNVLPEGAIG